MLACGFLYLSGPPRTQLTGIAQAVIASRARKAEAADAGKAARAVKRRSLYENLMEATNETRVFFSDMLAVVEADQMTPPILDSYSTKAGEIADRIYKCVTALRIDGSERASGIAGKVHGS